MLPHRPNNYRKRLTNSTQCSLWVNIMICCLKRRYINVSYADLTEEKRKNRRGGIHVQTCAGGRQPKNKCFLLRHLFSLIWIKYRWFILTFFHRERERDDNYSGIAFGWMARRCMYVTVTRSNFSANKCTKYMYGMHTMSIRMLCM